MRQKKLTQLLFRVLCAGLGSAPDTTQTLFFYAIQYRAYTDSPDIVFTVIHALHVNSCLLSGAYRVHLYDENKYLHFKYIQCRAGSRPKHVLAFAVQIEFHFVPEKEPSP